MAEEDSKHHRYMSVPEKIELTSDLVQDGYRDGGGRYKPMRVPDKITFGSTEPSGVKRVSERPPIRQIQEEVLTAEVPVASEAVMNVGNTKEPILR